MSPNSNGSNGSSSSKLLPDSSTTTRKEETVRITRQQPPQQPDDDNDDDSTAPSTTSTTLPTLSNSMIACICYSMHGLVNSLLLSPWCPARASFWNIVSTTTTTQGNAGTGPDWMLRWLSLSILQVHLLLAVWALTSIGNVLLEQRVVAVTSTLLVASLTAGVSFVPHLNPAMAILQAVIFVSLLAVVWWDQTNWNSSSIGSRRGPHPAATTTAATTTTSLFFGGMNGNHSASALQAWRSSSFDARRRLPVVTLATALLSVAQWLRVVDLTVGRGPTTYVHYNRYMHDPVFASMSDMTYQHMLFVAMVLTASVVGAVPAQQKLLLRANTTVLLVTLWMLAGAPGDDMDRAARRTGVVGTFAAIVVSVVGSL
jgi:hypothetical protein